MLSLKCRRTERVISSFSFALLSVIPVPISCVLLSLLPVSISNVMLFVMPVSVRCMLLSVMLAYISCVPSSSMPVFISCVSFIWIPVTISHARLSVMPVSIQCGPVFTVTRHSTLAHGTLTLVVMLLLVFMLPRTQEHTYRHYSQVPLQLPESFFLSFCCSLQPGHKWKQQIYIYYVLDVNWQFKQA